MATRGNRCRVKTKKVVFRLSLRQKMIVDRYCYAHDITLNKFIKDSLKEFLVNNYDLDDDNYVSKNQLSLFDFEDEVIEQDEMESMQCYASQLQMALF
ncbi:MAG: hypothetical protein ABR968_14235 [Bacteroidales bacterium]|jgi:hypothetical protein